MPFKEQFMPTEGPNELVPSSKPENTPAQNLEERLLSDEEKEKLEQENHYFSQKAAWKEFEKLSLDSKQAEEWFNAKFEKYQGENGDDGSLILLRNSSGQPIGEFKFSEISPAEKAAHSWGTLKLIQDNYNLEFIKHFLNEPELLSIADKQLNNLPRLVKLYRENQEKLEK